MNDSYIPSRGDIVWLEFSPQAGHKPALCISPKEYNQKVGLAIFCLITSQRKGYPFEVLLPKTSSIAGVIFSDHVKSLDWNARRAAFIWRLPQKQLNEVLAKLRTLI